MMLIYSTVVSWFFSIFPEHNEAFVPSMNEFKNSVTVYIRIFYWNHSWTATSTSSLLNLWSLNCCFSTTVTCFKGIPRQAEVALGVPGRLRPRIFFTFGTTRVVGRQPNELAAFTPGEIPGTQFQRLSRPQGTWFCRKEPWKKYQVTALGINPGTVQLVAQRLNHYATPGTVTCWSFKISSSTCTPLTFVLDLTCCIYNVLLPFVCISLWWTLIVA